MGHHGYMGGSVVGEYVVRELGVLLLLGWRTGWAWATRWLR